MVSIQISTLREITKSVTYMYAQGTITTRFSEEEVIKSHSSYFSHIFHRAEYKDHRTLNFIIIS